MDLLKEQRRFSLTYDGKPLEQHDVRVEARDEGDVLITVYTFPDGLKITNVARRYDDFGACEWVNYLENTGSSDSAIVSRLNDCDIALPFGKDVPPPTPAHLWEPESMLRVYCPWGSDWSGDEFSNRETGKLVNNRYGNTFRKGEAKEWRPVGGRSSNGSCAPYFNLHMRGRGYFVAIGWSGQWVCRIERGETDVRVLTGLEDSNFRLRPGERIRTSSVVVMPYEASVDDSFNIWRRFFKAHIAPIGRGEQPAIPPLCALLWGGTDTAESIKRVRALKGTPIEYIWMDASWYGTDTAPSISDFESSWYRYVGDWRINTNYHPDRLEDLAAEIRKAGMKFMLWFEPERATREVPIFAEHPEYFIDIGGGSLMLDLGNDRAWDYIYHTIADLIERLDIRCYRQDFNFDPLAYWRANDAEDRRGISEIKHITGLYRLWDALQERFPYLLIDNVASGGRRLDVELLKRSIPLWRSDAQCPANYPPAFSQAHTIAFSRWLPYSGTSAGRQIGDLYRFRSGYCNSLVTVAAAFMNQPFGDDPDEIAWLDKYCREYIKARPCYGGDVYPLTQESESEEVWSAVQFDLPEENRGIVQIFRRDEAPYQTAVFKLGGLQAGKRYVFTDADDGSAFILTAEQLESDGFALTIPEKHTAKLFFYDVVS